MVKSKFSYRTYIQASLTIITLILPIYLFFNRIKAFGDNYNIKFLFVSSLILFSCIWLILGIIKRAVIIYINDKEIIIKNILSEKHININDFDGFETTSENSKYGSYEVIYLIKDNKSIIHLSEFHISNYREIKSFIEGKINNLGYFPFSFLSDWKRYL
ncbi:MAG: hypothetical protein L6Q46_08035 [Flavobacterium sp.]|uniref:hypothetical protein n=1 Tax=Flavobacterium sp. TaxID=239 RepID=UPI0025BBF716|nr:hypothetical protein [Flavobacterium sp.]MCK6608238.1 hypothetical protein [Flavobacterium sp.]